MTMTTANPTSTRQQVAGIFDDIRNCTDRERRRELRWQAVRIVSATMEAQIHTTAELLECKSWCDLDIEDLRSQVQLRMYKASGKLARRSHGDTKRASGYLAVVGRGELANCQRPQTHDEMPSSTKRDKIARGEEVPEGGRVDLDFSRRPAAEAAPEPDGREATLLALLQLVDPSVTAESAPELIERLSDDPAAIAKLRRAAAKAAAIGQDPEAWAAAAAAATANRDAAWVKMADSEPTEWKPVTLFGEEVAPPPPSRSRSGKHKPRPRQDGLFDEMPPEPGREDPGLEL